MIHAISDLYHLTVRDLYELYPDFYINIREEEKMINNVSYNDKENRSSIEEHVGKPYGIRQRIRLGGIGSPRFRIIEASEAIKKKIENDHSETTNSAFMRKLRGLQTSYLGDSYIDYP